MLSDNNPQKIGAWFMEGLYSLAAAPICAVFHRLRLAARGSSSIPQRRSRA